jgi:hypothetical protein
MLSEEQMQKIHALESADEEAAFMYMVRMGQQYPSVMYLYTETESEMSFSEFAATKNYEVEITPEPPNRLEGLSQEDSRQYLAWAKARAIAFIEELEKA